MSLSIVALALQLQVSPLVVMVVTQYWVCWSNKGNVHMKKQQLQDLFHTSIPDFPTCLTMFVLALVRDLYSDRKNNIMWVVANPICTNEARDVSKMLSLFRVHH